MTTAKICSVCTQDVAGAKRVKDAQGHYYCQDCWDARQAAAPPPAAPEPEMTAAAMALFAVSQDQGPFQKLGNEFSAKGVRYRGPATASSRALYLVKKTRVQAYGGYGGGLAGALLSAALTKDDGASTCTVRDLPAGIQAALDPKKKSQAKEVVIIPRDAVSYVKAGALNNYITFTLGADNFGVATGLFSLRRVRRALAAQGWEFNRQLSPTAAPIHDMRNAAQKQQSQKPLWQRVLLVFAAILLIIAVIALRILLERH